MSFLGYLSLYLLACAIFTAAWIYAGIQRHKAREREEDMGWPGHSFRVVELPETEFQRGEALQEAARRVG